MICTTCGGQVEWQGPLTELTHMKCISCGALNYHSDCVAPPEEDEEEIK